MVIFSTLNSMKLSLNFVKFFLFLLYINDLQNSSHKLSFRLFADDANIFYSTKEQKDLETVMISELQKRCRTIATVIITLCL